MPPEVGSGLLLGEIFQFPAGVLGQYRTRRAGGADDAGLQAGVRVDRGRLDRVAESYEFDKNFLGHGASSQIVIPAQAGIQLETFAQDSKKLDSRVRGNDKNFTPQRRPG